MTHPLRGKSLTVGTRLSRVAAAGVVAAMASMPACGHEAPGLSGAINADGSSTVFPLTTAVTEDFLKLHPAVRISVAISGTGGGFEKFCRGETDLQNASRPISEQETAQCASSGVQFLEIPNAVTVVVHPRNDWAVSMTRAELQRLWAPGAEEKVTRWSAEEKVTRWSDVRAGGPAEPGPRSFR